MTTENPREALNEILQDMADSGQVLPCPTDGTPPFSLPVGKNEKKATVEVVPGVMVSQKLIDEAVRLTTNPLSPSYEYDAAEAVERRRLARQKANEELRQELDASRQIVQSMLDRMRDPLKFDEKFVSFDTMPTPLQRVIKAYIDAAAANKELNEAVAALQKDLTPPTAADAS